MAQVESDYRPRIEQIGQLKGLVGRPVQIAMFWRRGFDESGRKEKGTRNELLIKFVGSTKLLSVLDPYFDTKTKKPVLNLSSLFKKQSLRIVKTGDLDSGHRVKLVFRGPRKAAIEITGSDFRMTEINTQSWRG